MRGVTAASIFITVGATLILLGTIHRRNTSMRTLTERLQLPYGDAMVRDGAVSRSTLQRVAAVLVGKDLDSRSERHSFSRLAQPVLVGAIAGTAIGLVTQQLFLGVVTAPVVPFLGVALARTAERRIRQRTRSQVPTALATVASSLEAGATLERSIEMLADRVDPPLGDELRRLLSEVELGGDLVTSIERTAERLGLEDLRWWAYAVDLQQSVGGPLAPLTRNLAEVIREREELHQEIRVLTAEGRLSAYVLGGLPVVVFGALQVTNPAYLDPFFRGWGIAWLTMAACSVVLGVSVVLRMVGGPDQC